MTKLFVYWKTGSCNMGDCGWGLEVFDTVKDAVARVEELKSDYGRPGYDFAVHLIEGTDLSEVFGFDRVKRENE